MLVLLQHTPTLTPHVTHHTIQACLVLLKHHPESSTATSRCNPSHYSSRGSIHSDHGTACFHLQQWFGIKQALRWPPRCASAGDVYCCSRSSLNCRALLPLPHRNAAEAQMLHMRSFVLVTSGIRAVDGTASMQVPVFC
jgi:hypothetical protein